MPSVNEVPGTEGQYGDSSRDRSIYTDQRVLDREAESVFFRSWIFLAFESEIPMPGDYVLRQLGLDQVIVSRSEDGELHGLLNSCMHRGTQLCKADLGNTAHFRCSYHGWTYKNDGRLVAVPRMRTLYPLDFDKSKRGLRHAKVESYRGFVYGTWDHDAVSLSDYLGASRWYIDALLDMFGGDWVPYAAPQRVISPGNWKLQTENFVGDGYHVETTHKAAIEAGLFGDVIPGSGIERPEDIESVGHQINTDEGHGLRVVHLRDSQGNALPSKGRRYIGFPPESFESITDRLSPEQLAFHEGFAGMHGAIFPNAAFLFVSHSEAVGEPGEPLTAYLCWRVHNPVGPRETEVTYWTLVPRELPEDWKRRSYGYQARTQSAGGIYFEADDFENFDRIDQMCLGPNAKNLEFDYSLGLGRATPTQYVGPGNAETILMSETNQRNFYARWSALMDQDR